LLVTLWITLMETILFLYDVEFVPGWNPPRTRDRFAAVLRSYFESQGLDAGMSALGADVRCQGDVRRNDGPVTEEDRQALAEWIRTQPVKCIVRLGQLETELEDTQYFREITEWVFEVGDLTDEDRAQAARWLEQSRSHIRSAEQGSAS
jgi:uncharacterized protein YggL (DUF469 family)